MPQRGQNESPEKEEKSQSRVPLPRVRPSRAITRSIDMVELIKDAQFQTCGLTFAQYNCERIRCSGIFVQKVIDGGAAFGKLFKHDQVISVNGLDIQTNTLKDAVSKIRDAWRSNDKIELKIFKAKSYLEPCKCEDLEVEEELEIEIVMNDRKPPAKTSLSK